MTTKRIIVSQKIKSFRYENRLTQEQFATSLGLSPQAISKWEREECYPDITFLPTLAETLGCTVNDFFAWNSHKRNVGRGLAPTVLFAWDFHGGESKPSPCIFSNTHYKGDLGRLFLFLWLVLKVFSSLLLSTSLVFGCTISLNHWLNAKESFWKVLTNDNTSCYNVYIQSDYVKSQSWFF